MGAYLPTDKAKCKSRVRGTLERYRRQPRAGQRRDENGFPGIIQEKLAQQRLHLLQHKNILVITNPQDAHFLCLILLNGGNLPNLEWVLGQAELNKMYVLIVGT